MASESGVPILMDLKHNTGDKTTGCVQILGLPFLTGNYPAPLGLGFFTCQIKLTTAWRSAVPLGFLRHGKGQVYSTCTEDTTATAVVVLDIELVKHIPPGKKRTSSSCSLLRLELWCSRLPETAPNGPCSWHSHPCLVCPNNESGLVL